MMNLTSIAMLQWGWETEVHRIVLPLTEEIEVQIAAAVAAPAAVDGGGLAAVADEAVAAVATVATEAMAGVAVDTKGWPRIFA